MQCIGRTKNLRRCRNYSNLPFCYHHKFQPFGWFLLVATIIGLGAGLYQDLFVPLFTDKVSSGFMKPALRLSLETDYSTQYQHVSKEKESLHPNEIIVIDHELDDSFSALTGTDNTGAGIFLVNTTKIHVINLGDAPAEGVWFKLFFPMIINVKILGGDRFDYAIRKDILRKEIYYNGSETLGKDPALRIGAKSKEKVHGILIYRYPQAPAEYTVNYIIGDNSNNIYEGSIILKILTTDVRYSVIENERGRIAYSKQNLNNALDHYQNAIKVEPDNPAFLFNAGHVCVSMKNYEAAINLFKLALKKGSGHYQIWGNLGATYMFEEKYVLAKEHIIKALEINPQSEIDNSNMKLLELVLLEKNSNG